MRKTPIKKKGSSPTALLKEKIQAKLRDNAIERDGGCILRHYPESGRCGGYRNDGELILQAEHLNNRQHSVSFGDMDNIVCLCKNHHIFFKKREPVLYWILIRAHIGEERWEKVEKWTKDRSPHRMTAYDWEQVLESLDR